MDVRNVNSGPENLFVEIRFIDPNKKINNNENRQYTVEHMICAKNRQTFDRNGLTVLQMSVFW